MARTLSRSNTIGRSAVAVSPLGVGGGPFGNLFSKVEDRDVDAVIQNAAAAGVAFFDTSPFYGFGLSERRMGDALRNLPRDSFALVHQGRQAAVPACRRRQPACAFGLLRQPDAIRFRVRLQLRRYHALV